MSTLVEQLKLFELETSSDKSIRHILDSEANDISAKDEDDFFDRKSLEASGKKLQKIAVAFANSDGGEFVIGVADAKHEPNIEKRWRGASKIEDFNPHLQALFEIKPALNIRYQYLRAVNKPGLVMAVNIPKSTEIHKTADGTIYKRVGAQSLPIDDEAQILQLMHAKGSKSYEDSSVETVSNKILCTSKELDEFLEDVYPDIDPLDFLKNQDLVNYDSEIPKIAGLLLFADSPCTWMPRKCNVKIVRYETKIEDPERDHLKDSWTIEGPLYKQIHKTVKKIREVMSSVKIYTAEGLKKVDYPPEAIFEIVVNAIIHRDYAISDDIIIKIFDNRIEVISPGRLPGFITVDNILNARFSRNPKIERTLHRYKNPPNKDIGEGLNTAFQKMKEWKLKDPEIIEDNSYVHVIIAHTPLAAPSEAIIEFLRTHDEITNKQAREITGIRSENQVSKEFGKLAKQGILERVPGRSAWATSWRLSKAHVQEMIKEQ